MFRRFGITPGEGDDVAGFVSQPGVGPCPFIGKIETIAGTCSLIRAGKVVFEIKIGDPVCRGDVIKTAADGRVGIRFVDGTAFSLSNNARMMLREFACGGDSPSALFDVTRGAFAFIAGEMAKAGHLGIDTPFANIRGRTRTGGIGTLTLSALIFAVMEEARAETPGDAFLDDGTITYNGVFELVTKEAHPRHILVDNPGETIVLHRVGSSIAADQITNSVAQMAQLQAAQQDALHVFALGLAQGPTATGPGGSGGPPASETPSLFTQPINFTPPPDNTPPPPGPTGPGPNIPTPPPIFLDVIFTPPPTGPGKINEIPGHTGDKTTVDSTTSAIDLSFGAATLNGPTFVWSNGSLTDAQKSDLTAASQLTLSNSGGSVGFTYGAADHTFDFLAQGETLTVTYDVTVGGVTKQAIITVTGTNDTPAITSAAQGGSITEEQNSRQPNPTGSSDLDKANGAVTFTDVDLSDHHQVTVTGVVASGTTTGLADPATVLGWLTLGTLTDTTGSGLGGSQPWNFEAQDKNFDYLAAGEKLTLTYTVQVDDHNGGVVSQDVTIVVTGTNDTPAITSAAQGGSITEEQNSSQPNPTGSSDLDKANGAVTFTDVDLSDHHQVTVTGVVASGITTGLADPATVLGWLTLGTLTDTTGSGLGGSQPWTFSAQDKNFDYLAAGEKLTLTYTVQVDDHNGGVVSQDVTIVVTGTNDTPVIAVVDSDSAAATLTESYKTLSMTGTLTVTDADLSDTVTATVKGVTLGGTKGGLTSADVLGMLSVTAGSIAADPTDTHNLAWSFSSNPQTFNFLDAGESLTLTYTVQVSDGHGGITNQAVTITIDGTNQPDLITSFTGIDSHGYVGEHTPVTLHVSDGGVDVTSHATYQWQVLQSGHWVSVSTTNSFSQIETYEGEQLRVTVSYAEGGGTDSITTYLGQISDNDSDDHGATVKIQNLPGSLQIADGTALELAAMSAVAVLFPTASGAYGELVIDHVASYTGTISNFTGTSTQSDAIDLKDISYGSITNFSYVDSGGHGTLTITASSHDYLIKFDGTYTTGNFTLSSDGHGGTLIVDPPMSATTIDANMALTAGTDTVALADGTHQVSGTDQTVNNGDTLAGGTGTNTLTIDNGNGNHNYTFGDGNHADIGLTNFENLTLTEANATSDHSVEIAFDSNFHNNGTLTVDGSALTHLNGAGLTVDAHLAASDSFVIIGSASADTLIGGPNGNNTITGGGGGDTLTGGGGNDTFVFKAITDSQPGAGNFDTVTDFTHNSDHFDFAAISGLNTAVQGVTFNSLTTAPDFVAAHTIDIVTTGGNTVIYANASGATETLAHVDMEIHANNVTNVHSTDFILHA